MLFLGFGGMAIGQFMAILDIQIVAASLPQIQAGIEASADQVSWIQTAYLIPEVVMIPLSGFLLRALGTRTLFAASAAGFTATVKSTPSRLPRNDGWPGRHWMSSRRSLRPSDVVIASSSGGLEKRMVSEMLSASRS